MEKECVVPTPNRVGCGQEDDDDFNIKLPERINEECYFKTKSRKIHKLVAASAGGGTCRRSANSSTILILMRSSYLIGSRNGAASDERLLLECAE